MKTIAIIEDDQTIGDLLEEVLQKEGYQVERAYSGTEAVYLLSRCRPDLALLDLMLPGLSGEEVLPHLAGVPVIVVSAKVGVDDKVRLLLGGAADYLTKPFEPQELLACIRALTRRQPELRQTDSLEYGDLRLEKSSFTLFCGDRSVRLSRKEYDMMELFMLNQKLVITKENLLLKIWGYESDAEDNNVEVYVSFLRKKLEHLHSQVKIKTIRMVGYCLEVPES